MNLQPMEPPMKKSVMLLVLLAGCVTAAADPVTKRPDDAAAIASAKAAVTKTLKDPGSAQFTDLIRKTTPNVRGEPTDVVCGKVNAKTSFGGFTGSKGFVYFVGRDELTHVGENYATAPRFRQGDPEVVKTFCGS